MTNPERTTNANHSRRCSHIKVNGLRCNAPARRGDFLCVFHDSAEPRSETDFWIPIVEDHASFQVAINKVLQAVIDKLIDQKTAHTLLYGLQIAYANLKHLKIERRIDGIDRYNDAQAEIKEEEEEEAIAAEAARERHDFSRANQPLQDNSALAAEEDQDASRANHPVENNSALAAEEGHDFSFEELYANLFPEMPKPPQSVRHAMQEVLKEESSG